MQDETRTAGREYFTATLRDGKVEVDGLTTVRLGYRIENGDGPAAGNWVDWHWDGSRLVVSSDPFGTFPVFYFASDDKVVVSPWIDLILAKGVPRVLDLDALSAFLAVGYYQEVDTPFRDIRKLLPGGELTWSPARLSITGGLRYYPVHPIGHAQVVEGIVEGVRAAVARCVSVMGDDPYVMPVSGGRDSRHLLLELARQGRPPRLCITSGPYESIGGHEDVPRAASLCSALGIEHRRLNVPRSLIGAEFRKNRIISYGADQHAWSLALSDHLTGHTPHTFEGFPGGSLLQRPWEGQRWCREFENGRSDRAARHLVRNDGGHDRYSFLVSPAMRRQLAPSRAMTRVQAALEQHVARPNPSLSFRVWNKSVRTLSLIPTLVLAGIPMVFTPFMDPEFVSFAMSLPVGSVGRAVHEEAIATAFPRVAHVPYAAFGVPKVSASFARQTARELAGILLRDSDGTLVDRAGLLRRALLGTVRPDIWLATGRRPALIAYAVQLERLVRDGPARAH